VKLTQAEVRERYQASNLKIAFIGMSNIGKSMTAKRLAKAYNFSLVDIDHNIQNILGKDSMEDFAKWQGQPFEPGYAEREKKSLRLETDAMREAMITAEGNVILDTAGSVIYTDPPILETLKSDYFLIYIAADRADLKRLQDIYYTSPKPLAWAEHFKADPNLSDEANIRKCFPKLLKARAGLYAALADQKLNSKFIIDTHTDGDALFEALGT